MCVTQLLLLRSCPFSLSPSAPPPPLPPIALHPPSFCLTFPTFLRDLQHARLIGACHETSKWPIDEGKPVGRSVVCSRARRDGWSYFPCSELCPPRLAKANLKLRSFCFVAVVHYYYFWRVLTFSVESFVGLRLCLLLWWWWWWWWW